MRLKSLFDFHQTILFGIQSIRGLRLPKYQVKSANIFLGKIII